MLERGELSQITANAELADRLLATARQHLASARLLADTDPYLAYVAVYDAIRKALSALLQIQGLRATTSGGHLAVMHAVQAQFGASMGAILRPVDRIRVTRHEAEYPRPGHLHRPGHRPGRPPEGRGGRGGGRKSTPAPGPIHRMNRQAGPIGGYPKISSMTSAPRVRAGTIWCR
jgi:hypothetical protein